MYMADLRGRKAAYDYVYYTAKTAKLFRENLGWCPNSLRLFAYTDLNSVWYNSITEQGQMFWIAAVRGRYGSQFDVLFMLSISPGI